MVFLLFIKRQIVLSHSWRLPYEKHIVFLGASHITNSINDSLMESAINLGKSSERYMYSYIKLTRLIKENPQIDTVFLELAPTDLWEDADYKYHDINEQSAFVITFWPYFSLDMWKSFYSEPFQVLNFIFHSLSTQDLTYNGWKKNLGGYNYVTSVIDTSLIKPQLEKHNGAGNIINYTYLNKIISLCSDSGIKLFFLETPTYHPEYYYNQSYYYNAYHELFSNIEFLDYSKWPVDFTERSDAHHLNSKGANHFTRELMSRFNIK